jgi:hypothetical protein
MPIMTLFTYTSLLHYLLVGIKGALCNKFELTPYLSKTDDDFMAFANSISTEKASNEINVRFTCEDGNTRFGQIPIEILPDPPGFYLSAVSSFGDYQTPAV